MRSQSSRRDAASDDDDATDRPGLGTSVLLKLMSNPKDGIAAMLALAAALAVIVNALFLQSGPHPAPIFSTHIAPVPAKAADATGSVVLPRPRPAETAREETQPSQPAAQAAAHPAIRTATAGSAAKGAHDDPIALLLQPSKRVLAVQRVLAESGYGQIIPTGIEDPATTTAIRKFERARKLPVNGQISDRLVHELATVTGRTIE